MARTKTMASFDAKIRKAQEAVEKMKARYDDAIDYSNKTTQQNPAKTAQPNPMKSAEVDRQQSI